ncbi:MAG: carbohydrate kinase family protein [Anaerolineaceae bacterium]
MAVVSENTTHNNSGEPQILVIGDALIDHQYWIESMPKPGEDTIILSTSKNVGGSAANTAIALAWLGAPVKFCGTIGRDLNGDLILDQMRTVGVDTSGIQFGEVTGFTITMIDASSERTMFSYRGASSNPLSVGPDLVKTIRNTNVLLTSGYQLLYPDQAQVVLAAAEFVHAQGNLVALDPSPLIGDVLPEIRARILQLTDILLPNRRELAILTGEEDPSIALEKASALTSCVVVKLGEKGAWMSIRKGFQFIDGRQNSDDQTFQAPAVPVQAVDTTGAGDSFNAGFLASFLRDEPPQNWLNSGNSLAAEVVKHSGAVSMFCSPSQT